MSAATIAVTAQTSGAQAGLSALVSQLKAAQGTATKLQGSLGATTRGLGAVGTASAKTATSANRVSSAFNKTNKSAVDLSKGLNGLKGAIGGVAAAFGLNELRKAADTYTNVSNKLKLVTTSAANLTAVNDALFASANSTRSSYEETAGTYSRIARQQQQLGLSQQDIIGLTTGLNQAMAISGSSTQEAEAAMRQFGQAMASGTLRGDEFNSINENANRVTEALAKGLGVTAGELRKMSSEGKLTSRVVIGALQSQLPALNAEFGKMAPTISQAGMVLKNNFIKYVGEIDKATGASKTFSGVIIAMANNLPMVATGLTAVAGVAAMAFGGKILGGIKAASLAVRGFTLALAANPFGLIAVGVATAAVALVSFKDKINIFSDDTKTAANEAITLGDVMAGAWDAGKEKLGEFTTWFKKSWKEAKDAHGAEVDSMGGKVMQFGQYMMDSYRKTINDVIGFFVGGFNAIRTVWNTLPAVFGDIAASAGNALIDGLEKAINKAGQLVKNGPLGGLVGGMIGNGVSLGRIANPNQGAAGRVGQAWQAGQQDYVGAGQRALGAGLRGLGARGRNSRGANGSVGTDRSTPAAAPTSDKKGKESSEAKAAREAIEKLAKAREDLNVRMRESTYTARELAAAEALEGAGLDRNVRAARGVAAEIVKMSNEVFDAEKQFDDMTESVDELTDAKDRLAKAQNDLLAVTQPELAAHRATVAEINNEYAARMRALDALNLTVERRKELADSYTQERDLMIQAENARQNQVKQERAKDQERRLQEAQSAGRAVTNPEGEGVAQRIVEITRQRDDAVAAILKQGSGLNQDWVAIANEIQIANQEIENVVRADQMTKMKTAMGEVRNGIQTMFQGGKEAMLQYFADLALQFIQAQLMAKAMGTSVSDAFSNFGGGGASGGMLGVLMSGMKGGGGGGGMGGLIGGLLTSFLPGREKGGPVSAGKPYVVGEKRPEVFVPRTSGQIVPSVGGGSTTTNSTTNSINIPVNVTGGSDPQQTARSTSMEIDRTVRRILKDVERQKGR